MALNIKWATPAHQALLPTTSTTVGLSPAELLVRDVLAICTVKPMPEEDARVREFIEQSDIAAKIASAVVR